MAMPKATSITEDRELAREIVILNYGKVMTRRELSKLSLSKFESVDEYNRRYKYLNDLLQRILCRIESIEEWLVIMDSKTVVADFIKETN